MPVHAEQLVGEVLYRQVREAPLEEEDPDMRVFSADSPVFSPRQRWASPLTDDEACAVSAYTAREARWLDLDGLDSVRTACETGDQYPKVKRLGSLLASACSKSVTDMFVAHHYVRSMPEPPFPGSALTGRVYVLGGFLSMSVDRCDMGGIGAVEMKVLVPGGCGRGVFVGDREFLFPPGTTLKMLAAGRDTMFMERVRTLRTPSQLGDAGRSIAGGTQSYN